jgi:predicted RNA binding protein YcfA (HicA-like mRNA interferase family)
MPKLPRITPRKLLKIMLKIGFYTHHQSGSHVNLRHNFKNHLHVVIPIHSRELAPKTLKSILTQSEVTVEELADLL